LPGEPVDEGQDPRWQAIIAAGEFIQSDPEAVWLFIRLADPLFGNRFQRCWQFGQAKEPANAKRFSRSSSGF